MQPDNQQQNMSNSQMQEMSLERAKASLGASNAYMEKFLMSQAQQNGTMPMEAPTASPSPQGEEIKPEMEETSDLRKQYENEPNNEKLDEVLDEIKSIKDEIKEALEEDNKEEDGE